MVYTSAQQAACRDAYTALANGGGSKIPHVVLASQMWFHERDATSWEGWRVVVGDGKGWRVEEIHVSERSIEIA